MGKITNLTVKGQVTIPKDVRDALGLRANEPVEISYDGGETATIRRPAATAVMDRSAAYAANLVRLEAVAEEWKHLRTGVDTDVHMARLREPLPTPDPRDL
ncbi:AbrB/MazE/SpoVT family DNA-binding domain-containing protein [Sphingomonas sp.]|uniref:AbrB/MazE/SpoVT family DNA-binding domain-containing protein n=1 Tax=Sphingomonas sp. TaxID=28214 RepID=UPI003AFFCDBE